MKPFYKPFSLKIRGVKIITGTISETGFWIRFYGHGFTVTNARPLFSEREGFSKSYNIGFGFRIKSLPYLLTTEECIKRFLS